MGDLEGKVDGLVKLLSLVAQSPALSSALHSAFSENETVAEYEQLLGRGDEGKNSVPTSPWRPTCRAQGSRSSKIARRLSIGDSVIGGPTDPVTRSQPSRASSIPNDSSSSFAEGTVSDTLGTPSSILDLSQTDDSETCLAIFRDKMLPSFSFTHIAPDVTAQQLQQDRPFLFRAIMAVAYPYKQQKLAYGRQFKDVLGHMTVVQNKSSIDLLQGLLTFIAWSYDHVFNPSGTLSRLIMLATSLVCDLRLDKPLPSDEHMMKPMVDDSNAKEKGCSKVGFVAEEQRAVLACYALSSMCVATIPSPPPRRLIL